MFPDRDAVRHDDVQTNIQKKIQKSPMIILSGPTAVGKTKLSIALAKAIGGEIISADSCQVYRHMDIGSAKIRPEEMQGIPHHMIDILEPWEEFSVAVFSPPPLWPAIYKPGTPWAADIWHRNNGTPYGQAAYDRSATRRNCGISAPTRTFGTEPSAQIRAC